MSYTYNVNINGTNLQIEEFDNSLTIPHVERELNSDVYGINNFEFNDGDVVLDLGGHVGVFSISLAKKYPNIKIYTYEANPYNFSFLEKNVKNNGVENVQVFNRALFSSSNETLKICAQIEGNSGGSSIFRPNNWQGTWVETTTICLDDIFLTHNIAKCRYLKMDVEGAEFDAFYNFSFFDRVEKMGVEFHENDILSAKNYTPSSLYNFLVEKVGVDRFKVVNNIENGIICAKNF